ncbi:hypothetical protein [Brevundimonas variabilis]|uniref:Uncharacterized protein n=1 Tax=Brevundimonas variabilis TaxID=74312 RepID=A0A7W9CKG7_9CAUL|nr:hypothetical protein [Brevundimonas variabilis]MBB5747078.1 hypothetical protein [Brevundimonas variabilis]
MTRADDCLIVSGITGALALALSLMLGVKLISPTRFAQGLGGLLIGLTLVKAFLLLSGADLG